MCDCDCELPKRERWRQIREEALDGGIVVPKLGVWIVRDGQAKRVQMPERGEWFIKDNEIMEVLQSARDGRFEDSVSYTIWVKRDD